MSSTCSHCLELRALEALEERVWPLLLLMQALAGPVPQHQHQPDYPGQGREAESGCLQSNEKAKTREEAGGLQLRRKLSHLPLKPRHFLFPCLIVMVCDQEYRSKRAHPGRVPPLLPQSCCHSHRDMRNVWVAGAEGGCLQGKGALSPPRVPEVKEPSPPTSLPMGTSTHRAAFAGADPCNPCMPCSRRGQSPHTHLQCQSQAQKAQAHPGSTAHRGTWPRLPCLEKWGQPAAPPHLGDHLSAALRRCHPGLSRSCSGEKGRSQPQRATMAPAHSQMNWRQQAAKFGITALPTSGLCRHRELALPSPASLNQTGEQPDLLVLSPVPSASRSTRAWAGTQG